jgi:2-oxo-4-hydroxy-4-carboxy-5-ureidoimidazoline decarboxylase
MTLTLSELNALPTSEAERELLTCCGSRAWAREVAAGRPYVDLEVLLSTSDWVWSRLTPDDWREAFAKHPRIGDRAAATATRTERRWSEGEQSRAQESAPSVLAELALANAAYEDRFGHVFLICATGKSAAEILANARVRLDNHPERELQVAAEEQRRITHLRLRKLLAD